MFAKKRQDIICSMVKEHGAVMTSDLVKQFGVSVETVRRDLLCLEEDGKLLRVHGGAVAKTGMKPFLDLNQRNMEYSTEKEELSQKAMVHINDGDVLFIDAGSTAISFAQVLKKDKKSLTVVTHCMDVFDILSDLDHLSVILCGGYYSQKEKSFYGELTLDMLRKMHIKKAFIFPSAVSLDGGICDYEYEMFQIQKQIIKSSDEIFILADSSKFEKKALLKLEDMKTEYVYVTDSNLPENLKKLYEENGMKIC